MRLNSIKIFLGIGLGLERIRHFEWEDLSILQLGRNSRVPHRANHGARPNSSYMRRLKKRGYHRHIKDDETNDIDNSTFENFHKVPEEEEEEEEEEEIDWDEED